MVAQFFVSVILLNAPLDIPQKDILSQTQDLKSPIPLQAIINTNKRCYVLGEPVLLTLMVENASNNPLKVLNDPLQWEMDVLIARERGPFKRFSRGESDRIAKRVENPAVELKPGQKKYYVFLVLYTYYRDKRRPSGLAFPSAGKYAIKVRTRVYGGRSHDNDIESNAIHITVSEPKGDDLKVWQQLNEPKFLFFLQSWNECPNKDQYAFRAAKVLAAFPRSSYHVGLRAVLRRYYIYRGGESPLQQELICRALNNKICRLSIRPSPLNLQVHANDIRLQVRQVSLSSGCYNLRRLLEKVTWQAGVPLGVHNIHNSSEVVLLGGTYSLGQFMQMLAEPGRTMWVRDGDGYRLEMVPGLEKK